MRSSPGLCTIGFVVVGMFILFALGTFGEDGIAPTWSFVLIIGCLFLMFQAISTPERLLHHPVVSISPTNSQGSSREPPLTAEQVLQEELESIKENRKSVGSSADDQEIKENLSALCLSGGGIRSATFSLGIVQALARHDLLTQFDYLSTVSGGGYIGSWLTAWVKRNSLEDVQAMLAGRSVAISKPEPEPAPISWLRNYMHYLAPRRGVFSLDTWSIISTYLRNLLLNWLVLLPAIVSLIFLHKLLESFTTYKSNAFTTVLVMLVISALVGCGIYRNLRFGLESAHGLFSKWQVVVGSALLVLLVAPFIDRTFGWSEQLSVRWGISLFILLLSGVFGAVTVGRTATHLQNSSDAKVNQGPTPESVFWQCTFPLFWAAVLLAVGWTILPMGAAWWWYLAFAYLYGCIFNIVGLFCFRQSGSNPQAGSWAKTIRNGLIAGVLPSLLLFAGIIVPWPPLFSSEIQISLIIPYGILSYWVGLSFFIGYISRPRKGDDGRPVVTDSTREWWARLGGGFLLLATIWGMVSLAISQGPDLIDWTIATLVSVSGFTSLGLGQLPQHTISTARFRTWARPLLNMLIPLAAIFLLGIVASLSYVVSSTLHLAQMHLFEVPDRWKPLALGVSSWISAVMSLRFSRWFPTNTFSLHPMYRDRLTAAYLGASRRRAERDKTQDRFTRHDSEGDDIQLHELNQRPLHILNLTLNLGKTQKLAWQDRKAQSFSASPLHCGARMLGDKGSYQRTCQSGDKKIYLSAAMTISAAAANPNMGYRSSGLLTALFAIFNLRLGWWAGNPKKRIPLIRDPPSSLMPHLREISGFTDDEYEFINLSDGGHFDNLGLHEMVARRCRYIVVCDAEEDPDYTFDGLARAIRHVQVDFGVRIEIDVSSIRRHSVTQQSRTHAVIGTIHYGEDCASVQPGHLLYIKASMTGDEPEDVKSYKEHDPTFPHEPTSNQFFVESQFESYRKLGLHIGNTVFDLVDPDLTKSLSLPYIFSRLRCFL